MARRARGESGENPFGLMVAAGIGALILIAVFMFVPYVAGTIENSMPDLPADSDWNATANTDLPDAAETWATLANLLALAAIILVITIAIMYLKGIGR